MWKVSFVTDQCKAWHRPTPCRTCKFSSQSSKQESHDNHWSPNHTTNPQSRSDGNGFTKTSDRRWPQRLCILFKPQFQQSSGLAELLICSSGQGTNLRKAGVPSFLSALNRTSTYLSQSLKPTLSVTPFPFSAPSTRASMSCPHPRVEKVIYKETWSNCANHCRELLSWERGRLWPEMLHLMTWKGYHWHFKTKPLFK